MTSSEDVIKKSLSRIAEEENDPLTSQSSSLSA
eukprot:CAMPEP_0176378522 /NCGR_PEP_ID=MMETSP0126-20121128/29681_1 /TAXON_ID=141414 ORGANISM="Strombidinopsis acuminatum, Strain SPMC142" /NCGR_SAMPLE_ID=MMETSP0126 /ASSEMBLY_ACC=CAM_ASM_000229 /LENGTH=32 /DNA_ID= /DNA_START= /DNA_END= /DNA_ORIENTATION=